MTTAIASSPINYANMNSVVPRFKPPKREHKHNDGGYATLPYLLEGSLPLCCSGVVLQANYLLTLADFVDSCVAVGTIGLTRGF